MPRDRPADKGVWVTQDDFAALFDLKCEQRLHTLGEAVHYLLEEHSNNGNGHKSREEEAHAC